MMSPGTPLSELIAAAIAGDCDWVQRALDADPGIVDQLDQKHQSALHYAAEGGHRAACKILLDAGADPNVRSGKLEKDSNLRRDWYWDPGETPIMLAVGEGHFSVTEVLLECGSEVRLQTRLGWTALHSAASRNDLRLVELLLEHAADPDAWCWTRSFDEELDWYYFGTPLHMAAMCGGTDSIRTLLGHGAVERECCVTRRTPLFYAAARGRAEVIGALCEHGGNPKIREERYGYGGAFLDYTPLHYAAKNGHSEAVAALIERGAEPRARDSYSGRGALEMAEEGGHTEVVRLLLQRLSARSRNMVMWREGDWGRFLGAVDGFKYRFGTWPTKVRLESGYVNALEYILGLDGLNKVREHLLLQEEIGAHFVAEDERGRSFDYSFEGFPPELLSPTAREWLGVEPSPEWP
jgi:ankyrin repeat protein